MEGKYYTTKEVKDIFRWVSDNTLYYKIKDGFLPEPDIRGKPNKWLKCKIDAIIKSQTSEA